MILEFAALELWVPPPGVLSVVGRGLVLAALTSAIVGCVAGFVGGFRLDQRASRIARNAALSFAGTAMAANLVMVYALLAKDFSVGYVTEVGSREIPWYIAVISLWSSLNGSILFWAAVLGFYTLLLVNSLRDKYPEYLPWTLHVLMGISVFFTALVSSVADPFRAVAQIPTDGPGPNALLQNHWLMAVHPPTLYMGYVGMAVPFSMICAALLAGRLDSGWMVPLRRWTLFPWAFLTVGLMLGGWWSYGVLGWGGYWAWDPVENASFHPWLTGTAFLHSAMVYQRRNAMRDWTLVLGMATFLLTMVGTFMTRSGVFNSVHSFTQSDIGPIFLYFIAFLLVYSVILLAFRGHLLDEARPPAPLGQLLDPLGREFAILAQNIVFAVFTFTVLLGTLHPLVAEWWDGRRVSVGGPYFDKWGLPLGLALVFLMGVGPALPWGRLPPGQAARRFIGPLLAGSVVAGIFAAMGFTQWGTLASLFLCGFAGWANAGELVGPIWTRIRSGTDNALSATAEVLTRGRRRYGGHLAHYGVIMAVASIALSKGYKVEEDFTLLAGETAKIGIFTATFTGERIDQQPHRESHAALFDVTRNGAAVGVLEPRLNRYRTMKEPIGTPAVYSLPDQDLYLSLIEIQPGGASVTVRLMTMPAVMWLWWSGLVIALGTLIAGFPQREGQLAPAAAPVTGGQTA